MINLNEGKVVTLSDDNSEEYDLFFYNNETMQYTEVVSLLGGIPKHFVYGLSSSAPDQRERYMNAKYTTDWQQVSDFILKLKSDDCFVFVCESQQDAEEMVEDMRECDIEVCGHLN